MQMYYYSGQCTQLRATMNEPQHRTDRQNKVENGTRSRLASWLFTKRIIEEFNSGVLRTNSASGKGESLNPGPPDYKTSALNQLPTPPKSDLISNNNGSRATAQKKDHFLITRSLLEIYPKTHNVLLLWPLHRHFFLV